jgi:hypothetical protein
VTVPGGVPNLPALALTLDNIASRLQDMTPPAIRNLANQGLPAIFDGSNGGNVLSDFTPFGVITRLFAEFAAAVANADPNDIQGPEDLPGLMLDFIEGLPIIGELVGLLEAIGGTYDGDDAVLLAVQEIFHPIRKLLQLVSGQPVGFPTVEEVTVGWVDLADALSAATANFAAFLAATGQATFATLGAALGALITWLTAIPANLLAGALPLGVTLSGTPIGDLTQYLSSSGQFAAAQLTGGINTAVTISGNAISSLFSASGVLGSAVTGVTAVEQAILDAIANALGHSGTGHTPTDILGYLGAIPGSAISGALNTAVTVSGNAIGTLLGNIGGTGLYNATAGFSNLSTSLLKNLTPTGGNIGQFDASALTGALNTALTIGGQAVSTIFNGSGQFIGVLNSAATGALNTAITISGNALSTVLTNVTLSTGALNAAGLSGALNTAVTFSGTALSTLLSNLNSSGQFAAAQLTGGINTAVTFGGTALSTLLQYLNSSGQFNAAQVTGALNTAITFSGTALSTLLGNLNSSGQFAANQLTGALNTAVTVGGTALSTLSTNWNAAVTNINSLIGGVTGASTVADVATNINLAATNIAQIGTAAQNAAAGIVGSLNTAATQVQTAFSGVLNGIFGGLMGNSVTPTATTQSQATAAMSNVTSNIVGNATAFMALQAQQVQQAALMSVKFNFADYANGPLPSSFTVAPDVQSPGTNGDLQINNQRVEYKQVAGAAPWTRQTARYNVVPTTTDYQEISWTTTGDPQYIKLFYLRMNAAATSGLLADTSTSNITLSAVVAGVATILGAITIPGGYKNAARYTLKAGDTTDKYKFLLYENDTYVGSFTDASHVSQMGASYRYGGIGLIGFNTGAPYDIGINSWSLADQLFLPGAPAAAYVSTRQSTGSTSYTDLTTVGPAATVTIGSSGMALVTISSQLENSSSGHAYVGFAVSGATTVAAADSMCLQFAPFVATARDSRGATFLVTGLNPGVNTFTDKFKAQSTTTAFFQDRRISVVPL